MNRNIVIVLSVIGCLVFLLVHASELKAPEITERDIFGYVPFRVADSGAIIDNDGVIHGWVSGNTVCDAHWNVRYRMRGGKIRKMEENRQILRLSATPPPGLLSKNWARD